jgi:hypothetical protein
MMLGDAHANRPSKLGNTRLQFHHSIKQSFFIYHLYNLLEPYCMTEPKKKYRKDFRPNRTTEVQSIMFKTLSLPCFNIFYDSFYRNGIKIVPKEINKCLTVIGLAYWIMCDGYFHMNGVMICTDSFTYEDQLF